MQTLYQNLHRSPLALLLALLLLVAGLPLAAQPTYAQSRRADPMLIVSLIPQRDRSSNVVQPGELLDLRLRIENDGAGDADNVRITVPYNRDRFLLTERENIELGDGEFTVQLGTVPANDWVERLITLEVRNDVRVGTVIALVPEYRWDDTRRNNEAVGPLAEVVVGLVEDADTGDDDPDVTLIVETDTARDTTPPTSCMLGIVRQPGDNYLVTWGGSDNQSGPLTFDVQIRQMPNGLWRDWQVRNPATTHLFGGAGDNVFGFRVRARDAAGNIEAWPANAQLTTEQADLQRPGCPLPGQSDPV